MSEFVRVRLEYGAEASVPAAVAEGAGLKPLSKDAFAADGSVLPTKPRTVKGAASADHTNPEARPASDAPKEG
jgi:hypothetical protein